MAEQEQPKSDVQKLVEQQVKAQIIQAFHDAPEAIDKLVEVALTKEVTEHGTVPKGYGETKMPYLDYLVGEVIRRVAREAIVEVVDQRKADIKAAVVRSLTADDVVDGMMKTLLGAMSEEYKIQVTFDQDKDD